MTIRISSQAACASAMAIITHDLGVVARYADRVAVMYGGRVVETAAAVPLYTDPQHPYTEGLMASIPTLDGAPGARLTTISGQPPDLANLPEGCAFEPRCRYARADCRAGKPELIAISPDHYRACIGFDRD